MTNRETVELVTGVIYFSDDHWLTIWCKWPNGTTRKVIDKVEIDLARSLGLVVQLGRNEDR